MKMLTKIGSFIADKLLSEGEIMQKAGRTKYGFCW